MLPRFGLVVVAGVLMSGVAAVAIPYNTQPPVVHLVAGFVPLALVVIGLAFMRGRGES